MSTDRRLALSPLGKAPVWFALAIGILIPVGTALALVLPVSRGELSPLVMLMLQALVGLGVLAIVLPLWRREASFDGKRLQVKAAYYARRAPRSEFLLDQAQVVDLKYFAGLELEQIADVLGIARPTVVRDWRMARAWLQRELAYA